MRIEHLQYFLEVSRVHSMRAASESLHIAQQTISSAIQSLEDYFGMALFVRTNKGVKLTEEGQYIALEAQNILDALERIEAYGAKRQQSAGNPLRDTIKVICAPSYNQQALPGAIVQMAQIYPNVDIIFNEKPPLVCLEELESGSYDLALVNIGSAYYHAHLTQPPKGYTREILSKDELVARVGRGSPLALKKQLTKRDILQSSLVVYTLDDWNQNWVLSSLLGQQSHQQKILRTSNQTAYVNAIASGQYIGFLGKMLAASLAGEGIVSVPLSQKLYFYNVFFYRPERCQLPHLMDFSRFIKNGLPY